MFIDCTGVLVRVRVCGARVWIVWTTRPHASRAGCFVECWGIEGKTRRANQRLTSDRRTDRQTPQRCGRLDPGRVLLMRQCQPRELHPESQPMPHRSTTPERASLIPASAPATAPFAHPQAQTRQRGRSDVHLPRHANAIPMRQARSSISALVTCSS